MQHEQLVGTLALRTARAAVWRITLVFALSVFSPATHAAADSHSTWPSTLVNIEELRPITPLRLEIPPLVARGGVRGPSTLRVHIDSEGRVVKTALLESCGNPDLDEAAIHAMRVMRFEPFIVAGAPSEVTLVVPLHIPKRLGRSR